MNAFNCHWTYQVSYAFPPSTLVPLVLSTSLAEHVTGQFITDSGGTLLDGGLLASHNSLHVDSHSSLVSYGPRPN